MKASAPAAILPFRCIFASNPASLTTATVWQETESPEKQTAKAARGNAGKGNESEAARAARVPYRGRG